MRQAYEMASDALGLVISDKIKNEESLPVPSQVDEISTDDGYLVVVEFDLLEYQRKHNNRAVKKTLSIPAWLNEAAIRAGVNFSQVLQEALLEKVK